MLPLLLFFIFVLLFLLLFFSFSFLLLHIILSVVRPVHYINQVHIHAF